MGSGGGRHGSGPYRHAAAALRSLLTLTGRLAHMLGIGLGIDYGLLIINRFREERGHGREWNRYLGVAVGEDLGYLLPGFWTGFAGVALVQSDLVHPAFGVAGIALAPLVVAAAAEFVSPFEPEGWKISAALVPVVHVAWSLWLLTAGVGLLVAYSDDQRGCAGIDAAASECR